MEKSSSVYQRRVAKNKNCQDMKDSVLRPLTTKAPEGVCMKCSGCTPPINLEEKYYDGKPRPKCRGLLHGIVFFIIASVALPVFVYGIFSGVYTPKYWRLVLYLMGKGFSYGCSAVLHLFPFRSAWHLTSALKWDLAAVAISIWTSSMLVVTWYWEILVVGIIGAGIVVVNGVLVHYQFKGHSSGLKTPEGRSDTPRIVLLLAQFLGTMFYAGLHYGFGDLWQASSILYILSFTASIPTTFSHEKEPLCKWLPWHRPGIYGFHEDFHWLLLTADVTFMYLGLSLLRNPSDDNMFPTFLQDTGF